MEDWISSEKVKEHFLHPKNEIKDEKKFREDGLGKASEVACGDYVTILIKVDSDAITDCRCVIEGCAAAKASVSILTEKAMGKNLNQAFCISAKEIIKELEGLPEHKINCASLGDKALRAAINDYYKRNGQPEKVRDEETRIICHCINVSDIEIEKAVMEGARSHYEIQQRTQCTTVCKTCREDVIKVMEEFIQKHSKSN